MAARPRQRRRANWPTNLREPRPGYFTWVDPRDGKSHKLGRISLAQAIYEVTEANLVVERGRSGRTLAERVVTGEHTVDDLIAKMPVEGAPLTIRNVKYLDQAISRKIGTIVCAELTTKDCADVLEKMIEQDKRPTAKAVRTRMIALCRRGGALGWMTANPAENTEKVKTKVKRTRLTLEQFKAILAKAPEVADWLENAMLLALVSGQDRSTCAGWQHKPPVEGCVAVLRGKTKVWIEIPLSLRLNAIGMSLADVIAKCRATGVVSKHLIHSIRTHGKIRSGQRLQPISLTVAFSKARALAKIDSENAPSFHEIRSLSKRLYEAQGGVDTKALLGHLTQTTADLYGDARGIAPIRVKVG